MGPFICFFLILAHHRANNRFILLLFKKALLTFVALLDCIDDVNRTNYFCIKQYLIIELFWKRVIPWLYKIRTMDIEPFLPINTKEKVDEIINLILVRQEPQSVYSDILMWIQKLKIQLYFKEKFNNIKPSIWKFINQTFTNNSSKFSSFFKFI